MNLNTIGAKVRQMFGWQIASVLPTGAFANAPQRGSWPQPGLSTQELRRLVAAMVD